MKYSLIVMFALSMTMGTGPGVLLVNRPTSLLGIPLVYAWGLLWYFVLVIIALIAAKYFWIADSEDEKDPPR